MALSIREAIKRKLKKNQNQSEHIRSLHTTMDFTGNKAMNREISPFHNIERSLEGLQSEALRFAQFWNEKGDRQGILLFCAVRPSEHLSSLHSFFTANLQPSRPFILETFSTMTPKN